MNLPSIRTLFLTAASLLVPWIGWLAISLPCRYVSRHWGIAWAGFDVGLAVALGLTGVAALRRAAWLERAAVAAGTLLIVDAWFDVLTSRGGRDVGIALTEALAIELPLALLCFLIAGVPLRSRIPSTRPSREHTNPTGVLR